MRGNDTKEARMKRWTTLVKSRRCILFSHQQSQATDAHRNTFLRWGGSRSICSGSHICRSCHRWRLSWCTRTCPTFRDTRIHGRCTHILLTSKGVDKFQAESPTFTQQHKLRFVSFVHDINCPSDSSTYGRTAVLKHEKWSHPFLLEQLPPLTGFPK